MHTKHGPMVGLPYAFELNDVPIYAIQNGSSDEILKRLEATLAVYEREAEHQARLLTFGLQPISSAYRTSPTISKKRWIC